MSGKTRSRCRCVFQSLVLVIVLGIADACHPFPTRPQVFRASMQRPEVTPSGSSLVGALEQEFECLALEGLLAAAGALHG